MRKIEKRDFKKVLVIGGLSLSMVASLVACSKGNDKEPVVEEEKVTEFVTTEEVTEEVVNEEDTRYLDTVKKILEVYNSKIDDPISFDDLGCVWGSSPYVYEIPDENNNYKYYEHFNYAPYNKDYLMDEIKRGILIDNVHNRVVAGTINVDNKNHDLFVNSYDNSGVIVAAEENSFILTENVSNIDEIFEKYSEYRQEKLKNTK